MGEEEAHDPAVKSMKPHATKYSFGANLHAFRTTTRISADRSASEQRPSVPTVLRHESCGAQSRL